MFDQLLHTKLYIPVTRGDLVPRPAIMTRLYEGLNGRLTLVSAPAGFGKTTLISEWLAGSDRPAAWLSLDEEDSSPERFLTYFITAIQGIAPGIGHALLDELQSPQQPIQTILTTLLNEIAALPEPFILVLDDYHLITDPAVTQSLTFLLEHLPPQMHLVITTREDPGLPLARLRVRRQLNELRAGDLRFTKTEAARFLNQIMGLNLSEDDIAALEGRTEGWIAGLQLAALSMQGRADTHGFIQAFAGNDRYIVDYLVDEVLQRQPENIRRFLLQTAILDRLNGSLCQAVTQQPGSTDILESLERTNLFVVPLDNKRTWCRYHHLFADVLRLHLIKEHAREIPALHQRAGAWYQQNGLTADAVRHALAAKDYPKTAELLELAWPEMDKKRQSAQWIRWARALPESLFDNRPVLTLCCAWALLSIGELEAGKARLQSLHRWLPAPPPNDKAAENPLPDQIVVIDREHFESLPVSLATANAYHAQAVGDVAGTVTYARQALDRLPEDDSQRRARPASLLAMAYWSNGELESAAATLAGTMKEARLSGSVGFTITGTYVLSEIYKTLGRFQDAAAACRDSLQLAADHSEVVYRGTADVHVGLSAVSLEQGDMKTAVQHLQKSQELGDKAASPYYPYRLARARARLKEIEAQYDQAHNLLDDAEQRFRRGPTPEARPVAALKTRLWLAQGRLEEAWSWVEAQGLSVEDDLDYLREFDHITLARLLIATYKRSGQEEDIQKALRLLARLQKTADSTNRKGSLLEILLLQAVAQAARGNNSAALIPLERALSLAGPEGCLQIFLDEGRPLAALLEKMNVAAGDSSSDRNFEQNATLQRLLAAFGRQVEPQAPAALDQPLVEPLSERELEVLQLVAEGLTNRDIANRLYLAIPTVKGHNRNIYSKLQVSRRTEAVARARELGIL